mmetsp:Transcript_109253/g.216997  ORF Transcript_109253/g.216997 Transcript_109253/m.216997 type:complete len:752 (-) Transcript_109253:65-2320(-)
MFSMNVSSARSQYARLPTNVDDDVYKHEQLRPQVSDQEDLTEVVNLQGDRNCWHFVERTWFQCITALVIFGNSVTTFLVIGKPDTKEWVFYVEHGMLCFYVFEIAARICAFRRSYLCAKKGSHVVWNLLDILVVGAGVIDQWLIPVLRLRQDGPERTVLHLLRCLRLMRVLKIVRVFLVSDLSWTDTPAFNSFIGLVIVVNSAIMGLEVDVPWKGWLFLEHLLLSIYVFELAVRLKHFGMEFVRFRNPDIVWNVLDSLIVGSSVADSWIVPLYGLVTKAIFGNHDSGAPGGGLSLSKVMMLMRMLRLFRILRLVKLVKSVRPLFILVTSIVSAFQGVVWVLVLTVITLYGMAIITTSLIGKKMAFPAENDISDEIISPFRSVPESMFTLFRVMSSAQSEQEARAIDSVLEALPTLKFAFVFFMITSSWTLLSILTAVVSENMISSTDEQQQALNLQTEEEDREHRSDRLGTIFDEIDHDGNGFITQKEIDAFLEDRNSRLRVSQDSGIKIYAVREVLGTLSSATDHGTIRKELFVEYLMDAAQTATEKSMMKLEFQIKNHFELIEKKLAEVCERVQDLQKQQTSGPQSSPAPTGQRAELHENSNTGNGHAEKHPFEYRIPACDRPNQQLLIKVEEAQRKHIDFLESLERRWHGLEERSLGLAVDRLACAFAGIEPLRSNGELRFNYGSSQRDYVAGQVLPNAGARQERISGQAGRSPPAAVTVQSQGGQPSPEALPRARARTASQDRVRTA